MKIEHLVIFLNIVNNKSISKTAVEMGVTQQALSQTLKNLESELGVPIFERTANGVHPTKYGAVFYDFAQKVTADYQNTLDQIALVNYQDQLRQTSSDQFILLANPIFISSIVPPLMRVFRRKYPDTKITVHENNTPGIYQNMSGEQPSHAITLGIGNITYVGGEIASDALPAEDIYYKYLTTGHYVAWVSKNSPLSACKNISIYELLKQPIIMFAPHGIPDPNVDGFLHHYGNPNYAILADNMGIISQYVSMNLGISIMVELDTKTVSSNEYDYFSDLNSSHLVSIPIIEDARVMTLLLYKDPLLLENPVVVDFLNFLPFKKLF